VLKGERQAIWKVSVPELGTLHRNFAYSITSADQQGRTEVQ